MKLYLPIALGIVCLVLVAALMKTRSDDGALHETDVTTITDFSNRLGTAQSQIVIRDVNLSSLSNRLNACQSASLVLSNQLVESQSAARLQSGEITNLNQQLAAITSEKLALDQHIVELTNQVTKLAGQLGATEATLDQANKDYALLENRLRRDVAERLVIERKFYNPGDLQAQMEKLSSHPGAFDVTADQIYAGLDVEVKSNSFHVIAPD